LTFIPALFCVTFSNFSGDFFSPSLNNALILTKKYHGAFNFFHFFTSRARLPENFFPVSQALLRSRGLYQSVYVPFSAFAREKIISRKDAKSQRF